MSSGLFKNVTYKLYHIYVYIHTDIHTHKQDLALNNLQGLICYKPNQPSQNFHMNS